MQGLRLLVLATTVVCSFGAPQTFVGEKILGGEDAAPGEFPYMVSLRQGDSHFCGGTIISDKAILTAGHCVAKTPASNITVVTGTNTLNAGGNSYKVSQVIVHADFNNSDSLRNDVAILKLSTAISLSALEKLITLPTQGETPDSNYGIVTGWGLTTYPGSSHPNALQKVSQQLVANDKCASQHSTNIYPTQLCAGTVSGEGVCHDDSGGPLVSGGKQIGLVSWNRRCATGIADVYTRVASYIDWIAQNSA